MDFRGLCVRWALLGLIFYKYLSDAQLREVYEQENGKTDTFPERSTQYAGFMEWYEEDKDDLIENIQPKQGYFIFVIHILSIYYTRIAS